MGLDPGEMRRRYPAQLSGGQRQRVGVARALAADPPLMLMDEPFGAIDPITRERLQDEFLGLQERVRKTIVFVTHDIDEAIKMGDRIAILRQGGHLAQYGPPEEILSRPADDFVAQFVGADRGLKRLSLITLAELDLLDVGAGSNGHRVETSTRRCATRSRSCSRWAAGRSRWSTASARWAPSPRARRASARRRPARSRGRDVTGVFAADRHPQFGRRQQLRARQPPLLLGLGEGQLERHARPRARAPRRAHADRHRDRLRDRLHARAPGAPAQLDRGPDHPRDGILYTVPSIALFQLLVPLTSLTDTTAEIALVSYTLLILFRNFLLGLRGSPRRCSSRRAAWASPSASCSGAFSCPWRCPRSWRGCGSRP